MEQIITQQDINKELRNIKASKKRISAKDRPLTTEDYETLKQKLDPIKQQKERIILILGARGGLRVSEMIQCRLKWLSKTKLGDKEVLEINIPNEDKDLTQHKGLWYVKNTSTDKQKDKSRTTYLLNSDEYNEVYFYYVNNPQGLQWTREHITRDIIKHKWGRLILYKKENELPTAHSLRATAQNYFYYTLNFDIKFISVLMGHESESIIIKHYRTMNKATAQDYLKNKLNAA